MTVIDLKGHGHPYQLALGSGDNWLYIVKTRTFKETPIGRPECSENSARRNRQESRFVSCNFAGER